MSLTLFFAVAAGSAGVGWLAGRLARARSRQPLPPPLAELPGGVPFALGDVLVRSADDEAWLASALVLRDGASVTAVIFRAPRRGAPDRVVVAFPPPSRELLWLAPSSLSLGSEPPTALPLEPPLERVSRVAVTITSEGDGPDAGARAVFATYGDARGRAAILLLGESTLVCVGDSLPLEAVDHLPGG